MAYTEVFCPICGRTMGKKATERKPAFRKGARRGKVLASEDYIDWMLRNYDDTKSFGLIRETGYGGLKNFHYIMPEDDAYRFERFKQLFLRAINSWLKKKWLKKKDIEALLKK